MSFDERMKNLTFIVVIETHNPVSKVGRVNEKGPLKPRPKISVGKIKVASKLFLESEYLLIEHHLFAKEQNYNSLSLEPILSHLGAGSSSTIKMQKRMPSTSLKTSWLNLPSNTCS